MLAFVATDFAISVSHEHLDQDPLYHLPPLKNIGCGTARHSKAQKAAVESLTLTSKYDDEHFYDIQDRGILPSQYIIRLTDTQVDKYNDDMGRFDFFHDLLQVQINRIISHNHKFAKLRMVVPSQATDLAVRTVIYIFSHWWMLSLVPGALGTNVKRGTGRGKLFSFGLGRRY